MRTRRTKLVIVVAMICISAGIGAPAAGGAEPAGERQKSYYLDCIDAEIEAAGCKVVLVKSRSGNLREAGIAAAGKVRFLVQNKEALVEEMIASGIPMRSHAVHQYLLRRFNQETDVRVANERP